MLQILIKVLSITLAFLLKKYRNIAATNYNLVFGSEPSFLYSFIHTKVIFQILGKQAINILAVAKKKYRYNSFINNVENISTLIEAKNKGKGIIILSAHIGNFAMLNLLMAEMGYTNSAMIMRGIKNKVIEANLNNIRNHANIRFFNESNSKKNAWLLAKHLKKKGVLIMLTDQRHLKGPPLDFFGRKKKSPLGLAKLSILTGAPIVPLFALCAKNGKSDVIIKRPIYTDDVKMTDENVFALTMQTNQILEEVIREHFQQWFCFHRWWR
jgi:KDO2-lipid IV(A) lauroyltransferase